MASLFTATWEGVLPWQRRTGSRLARLLGAANGEQDCHCDGRASRADRYCLDLCLRPPSRALKSWVWHSTALP
eukprot:5518681-Prymnesium_polylepis.1